MKTCWFVVIQANNAWWVDCEGRAYGPMSDRDEAARLARKIAETYADPGRRSDVWVPNDEGKHELVWSGKAPQREENPDSGAWETLPAPRS